MKSDGTVFTLENEELLISSVQVDKLNHKIIENFIHTGLRREVSNFVDDYFMSLGEKSVQSLMFRQYVTFSLFISYSEYYSFYLFSDSASHRISF